MLKTLIVIFIFHFIKVLYKFLVQRYNNVNTKQY